MEKQSPCQTSEPIKSLELDIAKSIMTCVAWPLHNRKDAIVASGSSWLPILQSLRVTLLRGALMTPEQALRPSVATLCAKRWSDLDNCRRNTALGPAPRRVVGRGMANYTVESICRN